MNEKSMDDVVVDFFKKHGGATVDDLKQAGVLERASSSYPIVTKLARKKILVRKRDARSKGGRVMSRILFYADPNAPIDGLFGGVNRHSRRTLTKAPLKVMNDINHTQATLTLPEPTQTSVISKVEPVVVPQGRALIAVGVGRNGTLMLTVAEARTLFADLKEIING